MEASFEQARMKAYWRACFISVDLRRTVKNAACKRRFFVSEIVPELDGAGIKLVLCHVTLNGLVLCISDPGQSGFQVLLPDGRAFLSCFACAALFKARLPTISLLTLFTYSDTHIA